MNDLNPLATSGQDPSTVLALKLSRRALELYNTRLALWRGCEAGTDAVACTRARIARAKDDCEDSANLLCALIAAARREEVNDDARAAPATPGVLHFASHGTFVGVDPSDSDLAGNPPAVRGLAFAIDDYDEAPFERLRYSVSDAKDINYILGEVHEAETSVLTNHLVTRDGVLGALSREVLRSRSGDQALIYFSGHGHKDAAGRPVFATNGGQAGVRLDEIRSILTYHRGTPIVVFDACGFDPAAGERALVRHDLDGPNEPFFITLDDPNALGYESDRLGTSLLARQVIGAITDNLAAADISDLRHQLKEPARPGLGALLANALDGFLSRFGNKEDGDEAVN